MDASAGPAVRAAAVIVGAGSGRRMVADHGGPPSEARGVRAEGRRQGSRRDGGRPRDDDVPRKAWLELAGRTLLERSCAPFAACAAVVEIVLVVHREDVPRAAALRASSPLLSKVRAIVAGGDERTDSVRLGARACTEDVGLIAVHDAARPLVSAEHVAAVIERARSAGAALLAVPVADTIKRAPDGLRAVETLARAELFAAQTPQCFHAARFLELLARAEADGFAPTDDAALWEAYVGPVALVEGSPSNLKITRRADLAIAAALLAEGAAR